MPTTSRDPALPPIRLDPAIRNQALRVHAGLRAAIIDGLLAPGLRLPSSRALAGQLGIGRNMIVEAYEHLLSDGLVETRPGAGTYVAATLPAPAVAEPGPEVPLPPRPRRPFALGLTHVDRGLLTRLAAGTRRRIVAAGKEDLGYGDPRGTPRLREQIAAFLAVHRGIRCDPGQVVVVTGTQHGLRLCADALLARGDPVWMEDPGYAASKATLRAAGATLVPVPVDAEGLDVAAGVAAAPRARAVYVTPSHQFPTGVTLSMARRAALLDWAREAGAWIFEDDYDSEFRYSGPPLTALAGLGPERVIYLGTLAKTLFPGLRIGYLVLPFPALAPVLEGRMAFDRFSPVFLQDALAELMADGTIAAHLRRGLRIYREARDTLAAILRAESDGALVPVLPEQGLHMVVRLGEGMPDTAAAALRSEAGIEAYLLSELRSGGPGADALILGFSGHDPSEAAEAARRLAAAARRLRGQ